MERKAYTAFGETGFGEMGISETVRHDEHSYAGVFGGGQACAHRYKMVSASYRWGLGQCLSLSNSLDEEDVWSPCEGRSKSGGHNQYGFCQAGVSASVNKVQLRYDPRARFTKYLTTNLGKT